MRPIRVLHLVHTPGPGGTEAVVGNLLSWLAPRDAVQALGCPDGPLARETEQGGTRCFRVPFDRVRRTYSPVALVRSLEAVSAVRWALNDAIEAFEPDIVHAHAAKATVLAGKCRSSGESLSWKLLWHMHDYIPLGLLRGLWIRRARGAADSIVTVSRHVADSVLGQGHGAVVIHNAIPPSMPADPVAVASLLQSLSIPAGSPVIGYAGRLDAEKGVEELLRIFRRVCAQEPRARLLIAGGSPFQADAVARHLIDLAARLNLQDRSHFLGRLPDLTSFYAALTLFAHPAPREPFGLVVLEALAHGIPVVAFDTGGPREILGGFEPGLLVAAGDSDEFAATCCRVVRNEALLTRVRREGPGFVSSAFGPSVQCRAMLDHYRSMLT